MLKTMLAIVTLVILVVLTSNNFSLAQTASETDPRFEKLAKDLYPKAKQEGALVVYTIWDVEHIRLILAVFNKRFSRNQHHLLAGNAVGDYHPHIDGVSGRSENC